MKKISLFLGLLVLGLAAKPAAASDYAITRLPTSSSIFVSGSGLWGNSISGSRVVFANTAGDQTDSLYFDVTPPSTVGGSGMLVKRFVVWFNVGTAPIDAAPTFTVQRIYRTSANVATNETLTETESGCTAVTVNTAYKCVISLTTPYRTVAGERLQLVGSFNNSATSVTQITGFEVRSAGL